MRKTTQRRGQGEEWLLLVVSLPEIAVVAQNRTDYESAVFAFPNQLIHVNMYRLQYPDRLGSMSGASANAVLSGYCNIFIG